MIKNVNKATGNWRRQVPLLLMDSSKKFNGAARFRSRGHQGWACALPLRHGAQRYNLWCFHVDIWIVLFYYFILLWYISRMMSSTTIKLNIGWYFDNFGIPLLIKAKVCMQNIEVLLKYRILKMESVFLHINILLFFFILYVSLSYYVSIFAFQLP